MKQLSQIVFSIFLFLAVASPMIAQTILKDGKIPKDLVITLSLEGTTQFSTHYTYKITTDGKVFYEEQSNLPPQESFADLLNVNDKSRKVRKPKLKNKLSKEQIKSIILEFEKAGFFEMNESYYGDPTLKEVSCVNHAEKKGLSITANGKTKSVAFFLGCSYGENSPLKSFLNLYDKIGKELSNVKKKKL